MEIALTALVLLLCFGALAVLERRWPRLSLRTRTRFLWLAVILAALLALHTITKWETTSEPVNALLHWLRVLLYSTAIIFFTRLRPRWLTVSIAVILLAPLFASTFIAPLSEVFRSGPVTVRRGDHNLLLETTPWPGVHTHTDSHNSGIDYVVAYQPAWLPGLRHGLESGRLYDSQCNTRDASVTADPPHHQMTLHCPALPGHRTGTDLLFDLP